MKVSVAVFGERQCEDIRGTFRNVCAASARATACEFGNPRPETEGTIHEVRNCETLRAYSNCIVNDAQTSQAGS